MLNGAKAAPILDILEAAGSILDKGAALGRDALEHEMHYSLSFAGPADLRDFMMGRAAYTAWAVTFISRYGGRGLASAEHEAAMQALIDRLALIAWTIVRAAKTTPSRPPSKSSDSDTALPPPG